MRNKYLDLSVGATIKKIGLALAVFVITFGVVSSIKNAGGTYAAYTYTLNFELNGGTLVINGTEMPNQTSTVIAELNYDLYSAKKTGETFKGWSNDASCNVISTGSVTMTGDKTIYACYIEKYPQTINFYLSDGDELYHNNEIIASGTSHLRGVSTYFNSTFDLSNYEMRRDNFTFKGWCRGSSSCSNPETNDFVVTGDVTFYPYFVESSSSTSCIVRIDPNGGTWTDGSTNSKDFDCNKTWYFTNLGLTKEGFTIDGGTVSDGRTLNSYIDSAENGKTVTINWIANGGSSGSSGGDDNTPTVTGTTVEITLNPNGGKINNSSSNINKTCTISSSESSCSITLPSATKTEHTFEGWSTNTSCNNPIKGSVNVDENDNNSILYACYELIEDNTGNDTGNNAGNNNNNDDANGSNDNKEPSVNPNTGSWMLYIVYLAGILALGYTGYYSYKVIKSKND